MPWHELVRVGNTEFFVTVVDDGPVQVGAEQPALSFAGVRETLHAVASEVAAVWHEVQPDEATVEFGLSATAKTGKLTGLIVDGGGEAAFKVSMTWRTRSGDQAAGRPVEEPMTAEPAERNGTDGAPETADGE